MKIIDSYIPQHLSQVIFGTNAIRSKYDLIRISLKLAQNITANSIRQNQNQNHQKIEVIKSEKNFRLFFKNKESIHSFFLPYEVNTDADTVSVARKTINNGQIYKIISHIEDACSKKEKNILTIINNFSEEFYASIEDDISNYSEMLEEEHVFLQEFISHLLIFNYQYIRYDKDLQNYEKYKEIGKENHHPLHHLDFGCESHSQFKIGLRRCYDTDSLSDLISNQTACHFIE